jgi:hypothetical protein
LSLTIFSAVFLPVVLETNPVVAKPGGNGAQQVPERAEEVADAAAG